MQGRWLHIREPHSLRKLHTLFHGRPACLQMFAKLMGIDHVLDTVVGDEMLKGISGGQKRRVTCGKPRRAWRHTS